MPYFILLFQEQDKYLDRLAKSDQPPTTAAGGGGRQEQQPKKLNLTSVINKSPSRGGLGPVHPDQVGQGELRFTTLNKEELSLAEIMANEETTTTSTPYKAGGNKIPRQALFLCAF